MDCRAVILSLCLLIAHADCGPTNAAKTAALNDTVQLMRGRIQTARDILAQPGLLPESSCLSLNLGELVGSEQQPLTMQLSSFRCYIEKLSELTPEVSPELATVSQYTQDMERLENTETTNGNCSLPSFKQDMESYVHTRCLLELLDQRLSKAKF